MAFFIACLMFGGVSKSYFNRVSNVEVNYFHAASPNFLRLDGLRIAYSTPAALLEGLAASWSIATAAIIRDPV